MPAREPIPLHRLRARGRPGRQDCARTALADATRTARHCETAAWRSSRWITHRYVRERNRPAAAVTDRASGLAHCFVAGSYRMWPRGVGEWAYDPDVPHAIGTVYDSTSPRHGAVLRSELLFAVSLLKASVEDSNMFINHKTCPALVVSFHGRFSARILQVHLQNGRMVVARLQATGRYSMAHP
ncbi:hypothetical protein CDD83_5696 [Cordyceps sp. RAO-2017]|nr:hypothetical protein CDD83_5696 [Cordyceps sp. RAO-2017]